MTDAFDKLHWITYEMQVIREEYDALDPHDGVDRAQRDAFEQRYAELAESFSALQSDLGEDAVREWLETRGKRRSAAL